MSEMASAKLRLEAEADNAMFEIFGQNTDTQPGFVSFSAAFQKNKDSGKLNESQPCREADSYAKKSSDESQSLEDVKRQPEKKFNDTKISGEMDMNWKKSGEQLAVYVRGLVNELSKKKVTEEEQPSSKSKGKPEIMSTDRNLQSENIVEDSLHQIGCHHESGNIRLHTECEKKKLDTSLSSKKTCTDEAGVKDPATHELNRQTFLLDQPFKNLGESHKTCSEDSPTAVAQSTHENLPDTQLDQSGELCSEDNGSVKNELKFKKNGERDDHSEFNEVSLQERHEASAQGYTMSEIDEKNLNLNLDGGTTTNSTNFQLFLDMNNSGSDKCKTDTDSHS